MSRFTNEDAHELRKDFPIFRRKIKGKNIVYLDNANTSQKPKSVIDATADFYSNHNSNIHRGVYDLSVEATEIFERAHRKIATLVNSDPEEVVFTSGTTESLNMLAYALPSLVDFKKEGRNEIVLTEMEHHANIVPWQQLAKRNELKLKFIKITDDFGLDYKDAAEKIGKNTAIVSISSVSNALGSITDHNKIIQIAKRCNAITILDVAQCVPHKKFDFRKSGADFAVFSSHKMLGPTGLGFLIGKKELLEKMSPVKFGGDMISRVDFENSEWNTVPLKFEGGTPNLAGAAGLIAAIDYMDKVSLDSICEWTSELQKYAVKELSKLKYIELYNPKSGSGIISFNIKDVHPHDAASILNDFGICIRAGHHCTMPLMNKLGIPGTLRASFNIYNTIEDVDELIKGIKAVKEVF